MVMHVSAMERTITIVGSVTILPGKHIVTIRVYTLRVEGKIVNANNALTPRY